MHVLVTGATGLIGRALLRALAAAGHRITLVSRTPGRAPMRAVGWDGLSDVLGDVDAVVNLAGEPITAGRWTEARKQAIRASRVDATRAIVEAMRHASRRPSVLVNASATGYYGPCGDETVDESHPAGSDFLASVCKAWEAEAIAAEALGVRVVRLRTGIVLAPEGGALGRMLIPFRACLGGPMGSGKQWMPWIHLDDECGLIVAALAGEGWQGAVNATAPEPVRNRDFARALGDALYRPAILPIPAFVLRLAFGEMADILLSGQRAVPAAAQAQGYDFKHPTLPEALADLLAR
ncbi:MAG TPA: TIGR01777 family oxidoreductase [Candidatus Limnocylindria bacterium]|nr:TIGR01777 family oxidoreductase [Candidatus Limnocylindria bacterium]